MNKFIASIFLGIFCQCLHSKSIEVLTLESFEQLTTKHQEGTLYILDLDMTVLRPEAFVPSDPFFRDLYIKMHVIRDLEYPRWRNVMNSTIVKLSQRAKFTFVDPSFSEFYQRVGSENLIGLTARPGDLQREVTQKHFRDLDLAFSPFGHFNDPQLQEFFGSDDAFKKVRWDPGLAVLFVGRSNKGLVINHLVKNLKPSTKRIVFVDDSPKHVDNAAKECASLDLNTEVYQITAGNDYVWDFWTNFSPNFDELAFLRQYVFGEFAEEFTRDFPQEMQYLREKLVTTCEHSLRNT